MRVLRIDHIVGSDTGIKEPGSVPCENQLRVILSCDFLFVLFLVFWFLVLFLLLLHIMQTARDLSVLSTCKATLLPHTCIVKENSRAKNIPSKNKQQKDHSGVCVCVCVCVCV